MKMNTGVTIKRERTASEKKIPIRHDHIMSARRFRRGNCGRALHTIYVVAVIALIVGLSSAALGANPAEEMFKPGTTNPGGVDPKGDSLMQIQHSLRQFVHPEFLLRLFLSFGLAVACSWVIAWHPRRASLNNPLADFEERKALILLGMVAAVVAELSAASQVLAFVIFGIGALVRFRTALDNPKLTGKAIMVVVIGLACGMGSWAMAVSVTGFAWLLIYWLDSHSGCRLRIRMDDHADPRPVLDSVQSLLQSHHCHVHNSVIREDKGRMELFVSIPAGIDPHRLEVETREKLRKFDVSRIDVIT